MQRQAATRGTSTGPDASAPATPTTEPAAPPEPEPEPERIGASDAPWGWWAAGALGLGGLAVALLLLAQRRRP